MENTQSYQNQLNVNDWNQILNLLKYLIPATLAGGSLGQWVNSPIVAVGGFFVVNAVMVIYKLWKQGPSKPSNTPAQ